MSTSSVRKPSGFTLIELLVVITIIGILAAIALPNYIRAKDKAREVQGKANVHSVQVAVERYHTDFEQYPQYLLGGDVEGWKNWHTKFDEPNPPLGLPANAWLRDILIEYSYIESYPRNPFADNGLAIITQTGPVNPPAAGYQAGDGDPRFGFRGDVMGNGLEVPIMFRNWHGNVDLNIETERTLTTTTGGNPQAKGFGVPSADPSVDGLHYTMGGRRVPVTENGQQVLKSVTTQWPGNFFYRGIGERFETRKGWTIYIPTTFVKTVVSRYMIGGYGSFSTEGIDVARLESSDPAGNAMFYRLPPPWSPGGGEIRLAYDVGGNWHGGLPELTGGGTAFIGPHFPADRDPDFPNAYIYGSPDGVPDGIIIVLNAGDEVQAY